MHLSSRHHNFADRGFSRVKHVLQQILAKDSKAPKTKKASSPYDTATSNSTTMTRIEIRDPEPMEYPQASLLGLPAELRLQIYNHLAGSLHVHIDCGYGGSPLSGQRLMSGRAARLCNAPDATFPQLCTRPEFSGLHANKDLCYPQRREATWKDTFAIRGTCRFIYHETRGLFEKRQVGYTVENSVAARFLQEMLPEERANLTRLTILHANYTQTYFGGIQSAVAYFRNHPKAFPSLRTLAIQTTQAPYKFCVKQPPQAPRFAPEQTWQKLWFVKSLYETFEGQVTIVLDAWVVMRAGYRENKSDKDEVFIVRGVLWGERDGSRNSESEVKVVRKKIAEEDEDAHWKIWWKDDWLGYGRRPA